MGRDGGGEGRSEDGEAADDGSDGEGEGHEEEMGGAEDLEITNQGSTSTIFLLNFQHLTPFTKL